MASVIFNYYVNSLASGSINLLSDAIMCALMDSSYTPSLTDTTFDNTHEVSGYGYAAGGKLLTGRSVTAGVFRASNVVWETATVSARWAVLYDASFNNRLVAAIDFGSDISSTVGTFTVAWSPSGILKYERY